MADIELNKEQRQAVEELDENILLLAPAGTGKTNTLACRIAHIFESCPRRAKTDFSSCLRGVYWCGVAESLMGLGSGRGRLENWLIRDV